MQNKVIFIFHIIFWFSFAGIIHAEAEVSGAAKQQDQSSTKNTDSLILLQEAAIKYAKQLKENPSNHQAAYNLGVINYQLQQYTQAKNQFLKLLEVDSYHLIAKYNLGLISFKLGHTEEAINWFLKILEHHVASSKTEQKLQKLAELQLQKLSAADRIVRPAEPAKNQLKSYMFVKAGHDNRVEDTTGKIYTSDNFLKFYGRMIYQIDALYPGLETHLGLYQKSFNRFNEFDYQQWNVDIAQNFNIQQQRYRIRLGFINSDFGPDDYLSTTLLEARARFRLSKDHRLMTELRFDDHQSESTVFDVYQGTQQRLSAQYDYYQKPHRFRIRLELEDNDRNDYITTPGEVARSYSPRRQKIQLRWFYAFNSHWDGYIQFENRNSRYNDFSVSDGVTRDESRQRTVLQLRYQFNARWHWLNELEYIDNQSNIVDYDYNRMQISTGISGSF